MPANAKPAAFRPRLLLASALLGLVSPASAAPPGPTHPALAVERWTAVYTVVIERSGPLAQMEGVTGTGTVQHSSSGRATLSRTSEDGWEGTGSVQGSATESATMAGKDGRAESRMSGNGSGTGRATLSVHARRGTWEFHFPTVTFPTTERVTTTAGGQSFTRSSQGSVLVECPSFQEEPPRLPSGTALSATFRGKTLAGRSMAGGPGTYVCTVELYPAGQAPKPGAEAGGPYRVERGAKVTLDGSRSKGSVREWVWTAAAPSCGGGQGAPRTLRHQGATWSFVALCDLDVRLTVKDANGTTSNDTARVQVQPRQPPAWRTPFEHVAGDRLTSFRPMARRCLNEKLALEDAARRSPKGGAKPMPLACPDPMEWVTLFVGGSNVCARGDSAGGTHVIHPGTPAGSGDGQAYRVVGLADPGSPFDGWFYVDEYLAEVRRQTEVSQHILPGTPFYVDNARHGNDVAGYVEAVRKHEARHSQLMKQALDARDPAREVEEVVSDDRATVVRKADQALRDAERRLCESAKDPLPPTWTGTLRVQSEDYSTFVEGRTTVGGEKYNGASPCQ